MKLVLNRDRAATELEQARRQVQVDTIDRRNPWSDFVELARSPVGGLIEITDLAVDAV
jgi:hypothetical protein